MENKSMNDALRRLEERIQAMPCVQHVEELVKLKASLDEQSRILQRILTLMDGNGHRGLVRNFDILQAEVGDLIKWRSRIEDQQRRLEEMRSTDRRKWIFAVVAPFLTAAAGFLAAHLFGNF